MSAIVDHDYDQGMDAPRAAANWNKAVSETSSKRTSPDSEKEELHINSKTDTANLSERQVTQLAREKATKAGLAGVTTTSSTTTTTTVAPSSQAVPPVGVTQRSTSQTSSTTVVSPRTVASSPRVASPPAFHHSVDEVPQVLDQLDDSLPPAVPSVDDIQASVQSGMSTVQSSVQSGLTSAQSGMSNAVNTVAARLPSKEQVQDTVTRVREEGPAQIQTYWGKSKQFLEQFFSHSEDEDEDADDYEEGDEEEEYTTTTHTTYRAEEKDPQHMTAMEKEAYAYKLQALEARQKTLVLGDRINEKQAELDADNDSQSTVNQIKQSVNGAVHSLSDQLTPLMDNVRPLMDNARASMNVAGTKVREGYNQAAAVVDSNVHQALGVREGAPITVDTVLSQKRVQQAAQKLSEPVPVVVQGALSTVEHMQAFLMTYLQSYQNFYMAIRQQSMPMQIAYAILLTTHIACPLLFLDKPAARTVFSSTLLVIFASHLTFFLTSHLKFLFLSHILFAEMIFTLLFTAGWTWEQNVNKVLEMPFYELPLHPIMLRAYFYGVWVRFACMTTAMLLTLDSITVNALYQRYLLRVQAQQNKTSTGARRGGKRVSGSSSSSSQHVAGRKRKEHALKEQLRNKSLRGQIDNNISTINSGSNRPQQQMDNSLSRNAPELGELSTSKYNESLLHNLNASAVNQVPASHQHKWVKKEEQQTYNNQRDYDSSAVKLESHEKPMEGLRERKRPATQDYTSSSNTTISSA